MKNIKITIISLLIVISVYSQKYNSINIRIEDLIGLLIIGFMFGGLFTKIYFYQKEQNN